MPGKTPPGSPDGLSRLKQVVHDLRSPGGCPWDQEQTHLSLLSNLVEETYEVIEAARSGNVPHFQEELGDLLLQVVLHAEIASETSAFDLDQVAHGIAEKLIRRHPHVYGDSTASDTQAVLQQWEDIKNQEKGEQAPRGWLAGVTRAVPALIRALKLQKKASKAGFDWPDVQGTVGKIREECAELEEALAKHDLPAAEEELGDLFFSAVNTARKLGLDPEVVMTSANLKFEERFAHMEEILRAQGSTPVGASLSEMEEAWQQAKQESGRKRSVI